MSKELRAQVKKILEEYAEDLTEELDENARIVARETAKQIRNAAPRRTGEYAGGTTSKKTEAGRTGSTYTVYNNAKPQLTHLLENGHAKRNGGRVPGTPHWAPAEADAMKEYEERIVRAIK